MSPAATAPLAAAANAANSCDRHVHMRDGRDDRGRSQKHTNTRHYPDNPANSQTHARHSLR